MLNEWRARREWPDAALLIVAAWIRCRGEVRVGGELADGFQWAEAFENTFITTTPATMRPMPIPAATSSF